MKDCQLQETPLEGVYIDCDSYLDTNKIESCKTRITKDIPLPAKTKSRCAGVVGFVVVFVVSGVATCLVLMQLGLCSMAFSSVGNLKNEREYTQNSFPELL